MKIFSHSTDNLRDSQNELIHKFDLDLDFFGVILGIFCEVEIFMWGYICKVGRFLGDI